MAEDQAKFTQGSLMRHVVTMSLAASVGVVAVFLSDLIDMLFISMLGKAELAAAVGYAGALLFFTTAFGIGVSIAAGALVGRALGEGEVRLAERRASSALFLGLVVSVVIGLVLWLNVPHLARLIGASGETHRLTVEYLNIVMPSMPLIVLAITTSAILRAHGDARRSMTAVVVGGVVNAVLDPILIFGLGMELQGAAWASVAGRLAMGLGGLVPLMRHYGGVHLPSPRDLLEDTRLLGAIALPAILTQLATPVGQAFVTRAMAQYGEAAVSGMAIVGRITPVAFAVIFALSGAIGPIVAQNSGAGRSDRVQGAWRDGAVFTGVTVLAVAALLFLLRQPIASLFEADGVTRQLVYLFCGPLALAYFFTGLIYLSNASFNNLGHPYYSTALNWGLHTAGTIPFVLAGGAMFGAAGVLAGPAVGAVLFGIIAAWLANRVIVEGDLAGRSDQAHPHFHHTHIWHLQSLHRHH